MKKTKAKRIIQKYLKFRDMEKQGLYDCYKNPSTAKQRIIDWCESMELMFNGYDGSIIDYNTFHFTYGFIGKVEDHTSFIYMTPSNTYCLYLDECI